MLSANKQLRGRIADLMQEALADGVEGEVKEAMELWLADPENVEGTQKAAALLRPCLLYTSRCV